MLSPAVVIDLILGFTIGLSLGLLGGGGSILTVPALVYLVGQSPQAAISASLAIVGANSLLGATFHRFKGTLDWQVALVFGGVGMVGSYLAAGISKQFSSTVLLVVFALLMVTIGAVMLRHKKAAQDKVLPPRRWTVIIVAGFGVGLLTGILGVGGGFLIVPALVILVGLPMPQAVGTSLIIIAMNSAAGFLGHLNGMSLDMVVIGTFIAAGLLGTFAGTQLTQYLPQARLRQMFGVFVIGLAMFLLADNLPKLLH